MEEKETHQTSYMLDMELACSLRHCVFVISLCLYQGQSFGSYAVTNLYMLDMPDHISVAIDIERHLKTVPSFGNVERSVTSTVSCQDLKITVTFVHWAKFTWRVHQFAW